jgi:hypothetical protein
MWRSALCPLLVCLLAACTVDNPAFEPVVPVCAEGETYVLQPFTLPDANQLDILLVMDNGPGMQAAQNRLAQSMPTFVDALNAQESLDWRLAVTSMDVSGDNAGRLLFGGASTPGCTSPPDSIVRRTTPNASFLASCAVQLGETGDAFRQGFWGAISALDSSRGFYRPDANLMVVFFSTQDDCSATGTLNLSDPANCRLQADRLEPVNTFLTTLNGLRARAGDPLTLVSFTAGTGATNQPLGCVDREDAFPGNRFAALTGSLGRRSRVESICTPSFDLALRNLARDVVAAEDDIVCVDRRMTGTPSLVLMRPAQGAPETKTLSAFGEYLVLGPTAQCPKGAVAISRDARRDPTVGNRAEVWFCTDETLTP